MAERKRDHKRTLEARNRLARAQGYKSYADKRKRRAEGQTLPTDTTAQPNRRQIVNLPGRKLVNPSGGQGLSIARSQLRQSSKFKVRAVVDGVPVDMFSKGAWDSFRFVDLIDQWGSVEAAVAFMLNAGWGVGGHGPQGSNGIGDQVEPETIESVELELM